MFSDVYPKNHLLIVCELLLQTTFLQLSVGCLMGFIFPLCFAPFHLGLLVFPIQAVILLLWLHANPKQSFLSGFGFGIGNCVSGLYWVYLALLEDLTVKTPEHFSATIMPIVITSALGIGIALNYGLLGYLFAKLRSNKIFKDVLLLFPVCWVAVERLNGTFYNTWLTSGYSQMDYPLANWAPVIGLYGLSLLCAFISGLAVYALHTQFLFKRIATLAAILLLFGSGQLLADYHWTQSSGPPIPVILIQPNVSTTTKLTEQQFLDRIDFYEKFAKKTQPGNLIILPENAFPYYLSDISPYLKKLQAVTLQKHLAFLFGTLFSPIFSSADNFFVGAATLGHAKGSYYKQQLLPFGEYYPLYAWFGWFYQWMQVPNRLVIPGNAHQTPILIHGHPIRTLLCYEIASDRIMQEDEHPSDLIVGLSNDGSFGHSIEPAQHRQIAQMRALETGRYFLYDTNNGLTSIISPHGKILTDIPAFQKGILQANVTWQVGQTPFQRHPNLAFWLLGGMASLFLLSCRVK